MGATESDTPWEVGLKAQNFYVCVEVEAPLNVNHKLPINGILCLAFNVVTKSPCMSSLRFQKIILFCPCLHFSHFGKALRPVYIPFSKVGPFEGLFCLHKGLDICKHIKEEQIKIL